MYRKLLVLIICLIIIVSISTSFKKTNLDEAKYISVEVKGEITNPDIYSLPLGSRFNDLLKYINLNDNADISRISKNDILYNNQIIVIPKSSNSNLISINSASLAELTSLPGIGKNTAIKIIEYRNTYGSFTNLKELKNVSGIGDKKYERLKEYITL